VTEAGIAGMAGIVTGAASGIGAAVTRTLAGQGARIVAGDLAEDRLSNFVAGMVAEGSEVVPVAGDVRRFPDVERLRDACLERFGRIDFAVANAGLVDAGTLAEGDPDRWRTVIETNLLGVAYTVRAVLPAMLAQGDGHLILLASVSGREAYAGEPIYAASKWGVVGLGHALRKETVGTGVRVTLIEPGMVDTPLTRANSFAQEWLQRAAPIKDEDIARAIAFVLAQPKYLAINELVLRPISQEV
jgi:NADP-dependent 3-hydroxy acid dehydrogenase YdfG